MKKPQKTILVSGSLAFDRIMVFPGRFKAHIMPDKIHVLNVAFVVGDVQESFGGTAGNIGYNFSLLKQPASIVASVGDDFGRYKKWLQKNNIATDGITQRKGMATAVAHIITDADDNQITAFAPGALAKASNLPASTVLKNASYAIMAPDNPQNFNALSLRYKKFKLPFLFDPGQQVSNITAGQLLTVIRRASGFIVNDYELALVLKKIKLNLGQLRKLVSLVVVTQGARGSMIYTAKDQFKIPAAKPKKVVDPTGAGDAYRAGLVYGLIRDWPLIHSGRLGSLTAVYAIENKGTQNHQYTLEQLRRRYQENFGKAMP